jgi:hypothetical protein
MSTPNGSPGSGQSVGTTIPANTRVKTPAIVSIDGQDYDTLDWGAGGFKLGEVPPEFNVGDCFRVSFKPAFSYGLHIEIRALAEVMWKNTSQRSAGFQFLRLEPVEEKVLRDLIERILLQKEMPLPYDVETRPDKFQFLEQADKSNIRQLRWRSRWALIGIAVLGGLGLYWRGRGVYDAATFVTVKTAVIQRPVEQVIATHRGRVTELRVTEGDRVVAGELLLKMRDEQAED